MDGGTVGAPIHPSLEPPRSLACRCIPTILSTSTSGGQCNHAEETGLVFVNCGRRRRAGSLTAAVATVALVTTAVPVGAGAESATAAGDSARYIVQLADAPLASYAGGTDGIPATKPRPGTRIGSGRQAGAGEGTIIGVIDGGFWPESPSFASLPEPRPDAATVAAKWNGTCDAGESAPIRCNNKGPARSRGATCAATRCAARSRCGRRRWPRRRRYAAPVAPARSRSRCGWV